MPSNDHDLAQVGAGPPSPDPHGQAALLLVESLLHGLLEHRVLGARQVIEIVERAVSVQFDLAEAADDAGEPMWRSHELLLAILASLRTEEERGDAPPRVFP